MKLTRERLNKIIKEEFTTMQEIERSPLDELRYTLSELDTVLKPLQEKDPNVKNLIDEAFILIEKVASGR